MRIHNTAMAFIALACILIPCISAGAEEGSPASGVYAVWRGDKISGEDFESMRNMGIDGCLLPAAGVELNADTSVPRLISINLGGLKAGDTIGLDIHIVAKLTIPKAGWRKNPNLTSTTMLLGDMCRSAYVKIDESGGRLAGILLHCPDQFRDYSKLAGLLNQIRNNSAFQNLDIKFGTITDPASIDAEGFRKLADASDYFALDLTAMDLMGNPPKLIDEAWVVKSVKKMAGFGKPVIAILPMRERLLRHDAVGNVMNIDVPVSFNTILENSDKGGADAAANTTAIISTGMELDGTKIPAGTMFTLLKTNPGELTEYIKTILQSGYRNLNAVALDGLPYTPSSYGYEAREYVSSLKGAASSPAEPGKTMEERREALVLEDSKARTSGLWLVAVLALFGCILAGISVLRKKRLNYDEDSDTMKHRGGD